MSADGAPVASPSGVPGDAAHPPIDHRGVADSVNASVHYTAWSVFRRSAPVHGGGDAARRAIDAVEATGVTVRGWYDVSAFRADADLMVWWHAPDVRTVQSAYQALRRSTLGEALDPVWSAVGLHRPAEFNRGHVPAFLAGETPRDFLCVYPFVRSYEWYLLPDDERRELLREHGYAAREYRDVLANTVASFALSDYEWLLAFEADELVRIVDLMRELRATGARRHVREEIPFYTGPRVDLTAWVDAQPQA